MLAIALSWILLFFVFIVFGDATTRIWNNLTKGQEDYSVFERILIGLCSVGVVLLFLSIFIPLNIWVLIAFITVSLLYSIRYREVLPSLFRTIKKRFRQYSLVQKIILLFIILVLLIFALGTSYSYDQGLYHLQTMQWTENYKTIFGLGNLHGRLAFNSSFLLLSTLFNYHPEEYFLFFSINSFCLLLFSLWLSDAIFTSKNLLQQAALSLVLLLMIFINGKAVSSSATDLLPNFIILFLLINWGINTEYFRGRNLILVLLPVFCVTLKLSSVAITLIPLYFIILLLVKKESKDAFFLVLLGTLIVTPWLIRFVILTGYLVYPFSSIDIFNFDWKVPVEMVKSEQVAAYAWARIPNENPNEVIKLGFLDWFPIWLKNTSYSIYKVILYLLAILSPIIMLFIRRGRNFIPWGIAISGVIFGFITAPDFRFTFGFITSAGIIPFLATQRSFYSKKMLSPILSYATIFGLLFLLNMAIDHLIFNRDRYSPHSSYYSLIYKPQEANLLQEETVFKEFPVAGTTFFVPLNTNQCYDQQIPCTPYYNSNLELRGESLEEGFRMKK